MIIINMLNVLEQLHLFLWWSTNDTKSPIKVDDLDEFSRPISKYSTFSHIASHR